MSVQTTVIAKTSAVDNSTIEKSTSNELRVKDSGVTDAKLATAVARTSSITVPLWIAPDAVGQGTWNQLLETTTFIPPYEVDSTVGASDADNITYNIYLAKGTYTVTTKLTKAASHGILKIDFDGSTVHTVDCYNASSIHNQEDSTTSIAVSASGLVAVKIKTDGKNGSSSGYRQRIVTIEIRRTA